MGSTHDVVQLIKEALDPEAMTFPIGKGSRYGIAASKGALALNFERRIAIGALVVGVNSEFARVAILFSNKIVDADLGNDLGAIVRYDLGVGVMNALGTKLNGIWRLAMEVKVDARFTRRARRGKRGK